MFEEGQIVERELIDDHVRHNLSASDRDAFEASYLLDGSRREKLAIAESLWRVANEQQVKGLAERATPTRFWRMLNDWRLAFAGLAVAMLFLVGLVYIALKSGVSVEVGRGRNANAPLIGMTETREPAPTGNTSIINTTDNSSITTIVVPKDTPTKTPSSPGTVSSALASFTLLPGALRDEGEQSIQIAPNIRNISLRLNLPKDAPKYRAYSAVIKTADGETIINATTLKSLRLTLPASKLENRTYIILLEGTNTQNSPEPLAEYTFRVRR